MSISNGQIVSPIGVGEVASVLGASSFDVGTLCTHPNINKWSLAKPVPSPKIEIDRNADRWYDGESSSVELTCGMNYGAISSYPFSSSDTVPDRANGSIQLTGNGMFMQLAKGLIGNWTYYKPTGGSASPYRLGDFRGYAHNAVNPLPHVNSQVNTYQTSGAGNFVCIVPTQVSGGITLDKLKNYDIHGTTFDDMYLGVFAFNDNTFTDCIWVTQTTKFGSRLNNNVSFSVPTGTTSLCDITKKRGLYHCVTFFSSVPLTLCQTAFATNTYCVPCNNEIYDIALLPYGTSEKYVTFTSFKKTSTTGVRVEVAMEAKISNWGVSAMYVSSVVFVPVNEFGEDENDSIATIATGVNINAFSEKTVVVNHITNVLKEKGYIKIISGSNEYKSEILTRKDNEG